MASYNIRYHAEDFLIRLDSLEEVAIPFEGYPAHYLLYLLEYKRHYVSIYQAIIGIITKNINSSIAEVVFVDFGTGNGLLAMFARLFPFNKVIAIDLDKDFVDAASETARMLSIEGIEFVCGGEEVLAKLKTVEKPLVIVGTDVIEHIYDLSPFFKALGELSTLGISVFTTASNPENKRIVNKLMDLQKKEELIGGKTEDRALFGYSHKSFLEIRRDIITEFRPTLDDTTILKLAKASRGLRKTDILNMLIAYDENGIVPTEITHPTNTCNPETGSWSERLVELNEYKEFYLLNGYSLAISNGFYDDQKGSIMRRSVIRILNWLIKILPIQGRKIAPFIFLVGTKTTRN